VLQQAEGVGSETVAAQAVRGSHIPAIVLGGKNGTAAVRSLVTYGDDGNDDGGRDVHGDAWDCVVRRAQT
jgi:hypothetical protein